MRDNTMSLLCGRDFVALWPRLHEEVRQCVTRFGLPAEQAYDDLTASSARWRRSVACRLHFWFVRGARYMFLLLRLGWWLGIVLPLTARKLRGPPADIAKAAPRSPRNSGGAEPPLASIVVLSYNRLQYLQTTLGAFLETVGDIAHELIVVDNGSRDGSAEFLCDCRQRGFVDKLVLLDENQGISAGYNHGFAAADPRAQYFMKLDSDIKILSHGWLAKAADFLASNPDVGFAALNQVNHPVLPLLPSRRRGAWNLLDFADWTVGSAMIIPAQVKRELGCFVEDPQMRYSPDDIDYYVRASRKGYRTFFLKDIVAYHQMEFDRGGYWEYTRAKPIRRSARLAIRLAAEYDRGVRPLALHYEKYQKP